LTGEITSPSEFEMVRWSASCYFFNEALNTLTIDSLEPEIFRRSGSCCFFIEALKVLIIESERYGNSIATC
jgi:hypothetical protein